ncbi:MAG: aminomethyl-transferring glycine dehydrogenase subunit GcvPA [Pseudomonadales bacterium]
MRDPVHPGYDLQPEADRRTMLDAIGVQTVEDLFSAIPTAIRLNRRLDLPGPLSEWALEREFRERAARNATTRTHVSFLGGGAYDHYIPAAVDAIASRGEFLTAYTPYQPEMSQGLLQVLHDFQKLMGKVLGLPAVNCSVYDGATAMAEMAWMACVIRNRRSVAVARSILPDYRAVLTTYLAGRGVDIVEVAHDPVSGAVDTEALERALCTGDCAAFIVQTPNRFGVLESLGDLCARTHRHNALANVSVNPLLSGIARTAGAAGADIVCAEAQPLGIPLNAGGPYLGAVATRAEYRGYLPGRIVGEVMDLKGEPALALVHEEREQHVSRDRATSHICSNQALLALRVVLHVSLLGEQGLHRMAKLNAVKAHAFVDALCTLPGVSRAHSGPFFNETLLRLPCSAAPVLKALELDGIFGGIDGHRLDPSLADCVLVAVTETHTKQDLDRAKDAYARAIATVLEVEAA